VKIAVEDDIKAGLQGDEKAQADAIFRAYGEFAVPLASFLSEKWVTLDSSEIATAVDDVFIELANMASAGAFKFDGSLKSLLFKIARRRAIDQWRKKAKTQIRFTTAGSMTSGGTTAFSDEELAANISQKLSNAPEIAAAWKDLTQQRTAADEAATNEVFREFKLWLGTLPPAQKKVAELMALHFGEISDEEIFEQIKLEGKEMALGSVKSARREIRRKFELLMNRKERTQTHESRQDESS
jgi:DNA-directed RNA polymerase specialized sigma24 family protein